jgi:hypothetical protein
MVPVVPAGGIIVLPGTIPGTAGTVPGTIPYW